MNFLGLPPELTDYRRAACVILPVPYDATTSYRGGARLGPAAILDASRQVETFDEELLADATAGGIHTAAAVHPDVGGPERVVRQVERAARQPLADGKFLLALGGEHSITTGLVRAVLSAGGRGRGRRKAAGPTRRPRSAAPLGVLQVDAHADLRDVYEGSAYSHACVMRRLHQDLRLPIAAVGIRNFSREEYDYMRAEGIAPTTPAMIAADPAGWVRRVLDGLPERIYLTVDIDGLDPAAAPGTGTPEPGGLTWAQLTGLLRAAFERKQVVAADIVEVAPIPGQQVTEFLAARLAYKMIVYRQAAAEKRPR